MATGTVREWHAPEGWGIIDTVETPGGCWASFAAVEMPGYRALTPGQAVDIDWERAEQDGCSYRAIRVRPRDGTSFVQANRPQQNEASPYSSRLVITFDDEA